MSDISIKIENLSKKYKLYDKNIDRLKEALHPRKQYHRPFFALQNVNLTVRKGEILGLVGRNGAGKSTILKIISGVLTPTSGTCKVTGRISPLLGLGVGFNPDLSGMENIYMSGTIKGFTRNEMDERLDNILSFADIGEFVKQPVRTYSSGMNSRLSFAVAINIEPEILILDEVLSVGDALFRRKCFARMEELFESGCTVLFASHSTNSIVDVCTRTIFLDDGEIIMDGSPKLVTMYYLKYMYSNEEMQKSVRDEIISLNKDEEKKKEASLSAGDDNEETLVNIPGKSSELLPTGQEQEAAYLPGFQAQSGLMHQNDNLDIMDIYISTPEGKKVNYLVSGDEYNFTCKVKFNQDMENFIFAWGFKEERGRRLSGATYPGDKQMIKRAREGEILIFEWKFKNILYQGNYYINFYINKFSEDNKKEVVVMNLEALVFKVQPAKNPDENIRRWGIFDMNQEFLNLERINSNDD